MNNLNDFIKSNLPFYARYIMQTLEKSGFMAFIVGGCLRDIIMHKAPNDYDIATDAIPEQIAAVFQKDHTVIPTGIAHGTVTVLLKKGEIDDILKMMKTTEKTSISFKKDEDIAVEITTFRAEKGYSDNRHPNSVEFLNNIEKDLSRRDFTINAMAFGSAGFVDLFGGFDHIKSRTIACVGDANVRFCEDSLRILRGIRFACTLGFDIDKATEDAIFKNKHFLKIISPERINSEFSKMLMGVNPGKAIVKYADVFGEFMPELLSLRNCTQHSPYHCFDVLCHTAVALQATTPNLIIRLAVLLHDFGKPLCKTTDGDGIDHFKGHDKVSTALAQTILTRLKFDNKTIKIVCLLIKYHDLRPDATSKGIKRTLAKIGEDNFLLWLEVKKADIKGQSPNLISRLKILEEYHAIYNEIIEQNQCLSLKTLAINGDDLIKNGFSAGRSMGEILNRLLKDVIDEKCENTKEVLTKKAKEYKEQA